jgi:hypothetical protein
MSELRRRPADKWRWLQPPPPNGLPASGRRPERGGPEHWDDDPDDGTAPERDEDDPD